MGEHKHNESNTLHSTKARLQEAWQQTLGHFATREEGSRNLIQRLVDWGKLTGEEGKTLLAEWREAIDNNRQQLEQRVEETVQRQLARVTLPSKEDIVKLKDQLSELEARVRNLGSELRSAHSDKAQADSSELEAEAKAEAKDGTDSAAASDEQ